MRLPWYRVFEQYTIGHLKLKPFTLATCTENNTRTVNSTTIRSMRHKTLYLPVCVENKRVSWAPIFKSCSKRFNSISKTIVLCVSAIGKWWTKKTITLTSNFFSCKNNIVYFYFLIVKIVSIYDIYPFWILLKILIYYYTYLFHICKSIKLNIRFTI